MTPFTCRVLGILRAPRSTMRDISTGVFLRIAVCRSDRILEMRVARLTILISGTCVLVDEHERGLLPS